MITHKTLKRGVHITLDCKVLKKVKEKMNTEGFCLSRYINAELKKKFDIK
jgi:predicted DNA binding CopG/RHH family protein